MQRAALDRLLEILRSARERKKMYFSPIGPVAVEHWLHGLRTGFSFVGLEWPSKYRQSVVESHGWEYGGAAGEIPELERRGLTPEEVADELLAIEIDVWQLHRDQLT